MAAQPKPIASVFVWLTVFGLLLGAAPAGRRAREIQETPLSELSSHEMATGLLALEGRAAKAAPTLKLLKGWSPYCLPCYLPHLSARPTGISEHGTTLPTRTIVRRPNWVGTIELRI